LRSRIRQAYSILLPQNELAPGINPVRKRLLIVSGRDATVDITVVPEQPGNANGGPHPTIGVDLHASINARLHAIEVAQASLRDDMHHLFEQQAQQIRLLNTNIRRIAIQPIVRRAAPVGAPQVGAATLSALPRDLHTLWQEYVLGIGGRKPARLFTTQER